jgi:two-component system chemotaxis response regulator CheB
MSGDDAALVPVRRYTAVAIGGSSGGFEALQRLLAPLPSDLGLAILVALHREPSPDDLLVRLLARRCRLPVQEAVEKEAVRPGVVYLAPPNYHLLVELDHSLSLSVDPRVSFARPSIDVLFETAADAYRWRLIGVLLSGANSDGTDGLRWIKARGGLTVAQDPVGAQAEAMPRSAIQAGVVDRVLSLDEIAALLIEECGLSPGGRG